MAADQTRGERLLSWASGREQRKGLRPRDAAILIISVWFPCFPRGQRTLKTQQASRSSRLEHLLRGHRLSEQTRLLDSVG
jgi:hypothetical protein